MLNALTNSLALFRFGGGRGGGGFLLLLVLVVAGAAIWALAHSGRSNSASNSPKE